MHPVDVIWKRIFLCISGTIPAARSNILLLPNVITPDELIFLLVLAHCAAFIKRCSLP